MKKEDNVKTHPIIYASFLSRVTAFITDIFMIGIPVSLLAMMVFGYDQVNTAGAMDVVMQTQKATDNAPSPITTIAQLLISAIVYVTFWYKTGQTPGKKMARIKVVDAKTLKKASFMQLTLRFIGYYISTLTLFLGFLLPLVHKDKKALHDLLSQTAVIYE